MYIYASIYIYMRVHKILSLTKKPEQFIFTAMVI